MEEKILLSLKEFSEYIGISESTARKILKRNNNKFTNIIGNRLYANKKILDEELERCAKYQIPL